MQNEFTELQERWLKNLEGGEYRQGVGFLLKDGEFCCLGVAVHTVDPQHIHMRFGGDLPDDVAQKMHFRGNFGELLTEHKNQTSLSVLNDYEEMTFAEIAAFIRANPWQVFTNFSEPTTTEIVQPATAEELGNIETEEGEVKPW